ncbi:MAG: PEP-CTERM sorting domain-containing protein [Betaproteobacteria bacterium]|nr:PEP-CTERM sorting domain-containing protein [Betaproteobacteria bacterium]
MTHHFTRTLAIAGLLLATSSSQAAISTFDTGAEGWTALGDVEGTLTWSATGGNPDGHVLIDDLTTGGVTYFVAPAKFLGNQSAALGTDLAFDLMQVYPGGANQFDSPDVVLQGGGLTLAFDTAVNPANGSWTHYAVPLSAPGWTVNSLSGAAATPEQFSAVLSDLTALRIRAEYQTGADVGHLDNVALVPEPATTAMMLLGLGALGLATRRRRTAD